jgi:hypothetical protein
MGRPLRPPHQVLYGLGDTSLEWVKNEEILGEVSGACHDHCADIV